MLKRSAPTESMALVEPEKLITERESGISSSSSWAEMLVSSDLPPGAVVLIFEKVTRAIAEFENHQLATPFGCNFFRLSLSLAYLINRLGRSRPLATPDDAYCQAYSLPQHSPMARLPRGAAHRSSRPRTLS